MQGRVIPLKQITADEIRAWRSLAARAVQPNPLFEPECLLPARDHLGNGARISLAVAEEDGKFFGCFPIETVPHWRAFRRPVASSQVRRMQYDGTPLIDMDRGVQAASSLLGAVSRQRKSSAPGLLMLYWLSADGPVTSYFDKAASDVGIPKYRYQTWDRPVVQRREDGNYRSIHGGKFLRNLNRLRRHMDDELGEPVRLVERGADESAIDTVIAIEAAGYKARTGVAMVGHDGEPEWFRHMCAEFRESGRLLLYALEGGGRTVAIQMFLRHGSRAFLIKLAYDEKFSRFRPGLQLQLDVIDHVFATTDLEWIDSCTYEANETLLRMYPDRRMVTNDVFGVGTSVDKAYLRTTSKVREIVKSDSAFRKRHHRFDAGLTAAFRR